MDHLRKLARIQSGAAGFIPFDEPTATSWTATACKNTAKVAAYCKTHKSQSLPTVIKKSAS
jgi:hypothetical protein